ncbi:MAG: FAD-dependent oxidoreductase [Armatimonadota bacterium]
MKMSDSTSTSRQIDSIPDDAINCDVLVVGAGASGIPAAIAAARQGARVVLLEEDLVPGGAPVDMYVTYLCAGPRVGIFSEITSRLNAGHNLVGRPEALQWDDWYLPSSWLQVLSEMLAAEPLITLQCGSPVTRVLARDDGNRRRVQGVVVERMGMPSRAYTAPVTIDATGTGLIAALAGCETQYGRNARGEFNEPYGPEQADSRVQPCTWMYISQRMRLDAPLPKGTGGMPWLPYLPEEEKWNAGLFLHWGVTVFCENTLDTSALAEASRQALAQVTPTLNALRAEGFTVHLAPKLGVRETRRVLGDAVVTATDLLEGRYPDDTVAHAEFFLDAWGEHDVLPRTDVRGGIPYRALLPRDTEGLLIAGKSISGTHLAMSAYRCQPSMASVGAAAGVAAALTAELQTATRGIPLDELQARLRVMGVLPAEAADIRVKSAIDDHQVTK